MLPPPPPTTKASGALLNMEIFLKTDAIFFHSSTCVASIIRIVEVSKAVPTDLPYTNAQSSTWTAMEMQVAIFSANLPSLAPLLGHFLHNKKGTKPSYPNASDQTRINSGRRGPSGSHDQKSTHLTSSDGPGRMSDDLSWQSRGDSLRDLELGDQTTLVKGDRGCSNVSKDPIGNHPDTYEMQVVSSGACK